MSPFGATATSEMDASANPEVPVTRNISQSTANCHYESALPIHGSTYCPEVIEAEPMDIVVEPLMTPATTISLLEVVSIILAITGLDALPDADQSLELLEER